MAEKGKESSLKQIANKIVKLFKEVKSELKKVVWLTRKQLINNTIAVFAICLLFGIIIWIVDFGFARIFEFTFK
ncbi:MAG: preprotein translocase subunit SecE [Clostridiaceae bacterium]|jgi:preprotein translocase subunit SecE|nr:preprotein translocase subunit SecE [Clostridiaceae bacterium]